MIFELKDNDLFVFSKQRDSLRLTLKWALLILVFLSPWGGCMSYLSSARVQKNSSRKAPTAQESLSVSKCLAGLPRTPVAMWKGRLVAALEGVAALFKVSQCLTHSPSAPTQAWRGCWGSGGACWWRWRWWWWMRWQTPWWTACTSQSRARRWRWKGSAPRWPEGTRSRTARQRCWGSSSLLDEMRRRQTQQPTCYGLNCSSPHIYSAS